MRVEDSLRCVPAVFFLSDYGLRDEFVGVVHAVLDRLLPGIRVVDLTHQIPAFDFRAGALALHRALPYLGQGVVLAVVDPGVGTDRRCIALDCGGNRQMVAPDNGLLSLVGSDLGIVRAVVLDFERVRELCRKVLGDQLDSPSSVVTFDGRDLMAPAAALLARGVPVVELGSALDPADIVRISIARPRCVGTGLEAEVSWIDGFGNVQLWATPSDLTVLGFSGAGGALGPPGGRSSLLAGEGLGSPQAVNVVLASGKAVFKARLVRAFGDLEPGELGMLVDSDARLALVVASGSAARLLGVEEADVVLLSVGQGGPQGAGRVVQGGRPGA